MTHECDYPPSVRHLSKVTRTLIPADATSREIDSLVREQLKTKQALYTLDLTALRDLQPDLIVTQALCDVCAVAESEVRAAACSLSGGPRVINLEPTSLDDVFNCLREVGLATGRAKRAVEEIAKLRARVAAVAKRAERMVSRPRVILLEWIDPPFSSGHWSPELVRLAGGEEVVGVAGERSRTLDWQQIVAAAPEVMLIACCGFDVERTLADLPILRGYSGWDKLPCVRAEKSLRRRRLRVFQPPWPAAGRFAGNPRARARSGNPPAAMRPRGGSAGWSKRHIIVNSWEVIRPFARRPT